MELGTISREIYVDAAPEIVFDVVSSPEHVKQWWPDEASYDPTPWSEGEIVFEQKEGDASVVSLTVVEVQPPRTFSFRWAYPAGQEPRAGNSFLVTFELTPNGDGTHLTMTETGFREMGWEAAVLEEQYQDHVHGWDFFLPRLVTYVQGLAVRP